jgi:hypothetical protein
MRVRSFVSWGIVVMGFILRGYKNLRELSRLSSNADSQGLRKKHPGWFINSITRTFLTNQKKPPNPQGLSW